jgi:N-acyl-D-amino-acid deacylase
MNLIQIAADYKKANPNASGIEALAGKSMNDEDVAEFSNGIMSNICSDGAAGGHPRGYGAFTRVLGKYVRAEKALSLSQAIHKMTGLTAEHVGLRSKEEK